jgi:hypothetical protein
MADSQQHAGKLHWVENIIYVDDDEPASRARGVPRCTVVVRLPLSVMSEAVAV